jgi:hypothetical protein
LSLPSHKPGTTSAANFSQNQYDRTVRLLLLENHVFRGTRIGRSIAARDVLNSKKATARLFQLPLKLKVSS